MDSTVQKVSTVHKCLVVLVVAVVISTLCVLATVLGLVWSMPDLPKSVITDEICLPDQSGNLICGKTEERLYDYTNAVSELHVCMNSMSP